ncbi:lactococcin 972 family bacteriocin [Streptomyces sp. NPDC058683]|uniref:lactococcin 972 family bacteriocin n=1 Tax=Streptomyces sp. NPDC058683 TaxID=3346597 RepID=UPI003654886D
MVLAVCSFAAPAAADSPRVATVTAHGTVIAADGSKVGQITFHKRGDGTKPPAELGNPSQWGVATVSVHHSVGAVSPLSEACVPASGGQWCYGYYLNTSGKYCYSNYYHHDDVHKSSVKIAGGTVDSGWVAANDYSNAHRTAGAAYTCETYYSIK